MLKISNLIKNNNFTGIINKLVIINFILAVAALLKDMALAAYMGTSSFSDVLLLSFSAVDIFSNNLFAAAVGISCVPVFASAIIEGREEFGKCIMSILTVVILMSVLCGFLIYIFRDGIIVMLVSGLTPENRLLSLKLLVIFLPAAIFYPIIMAGTSAMQVRSRFLIPAAAPVIFNVVFLFAIIQNMILHTPFSKGIYIIAFSIMAGILLMTVIIWVPLIKDIPGNIRNESALKYIYRNSKNIKEFLKIFISYFFILLSSQIILYIERFIAVKMGTGYISGLNYAYRLSQFGIWVFAAAVGSAAFPSMTYLNKKNERVKLAEIFKKSIEILFIIILPVSIGLFILRVPAVSILLRHGEFGFESTQITSDILSGYAIAIIGQAFSYICLRCLIAVREMKLSLIACTISGVLNIYLDFTLVKYIGISSIGYGAAAASLINSILLLIFINKIFNIHDKGSIGHIFKIIISNLPVMLVSLIYARLWNYRLMSSTTTGQALYVLSFAIICSLAYFTSLRFTNTLMSI